MLKKYNHMISKAMLSDIQILVPGGVNKNVSLSEISRWRTGGLADLIIKPSNPKQVASLRRYFYENGIRHIVIGMTSNLLFSDEGIRVPCIQIDSRMGQMSCIDGIVTAQAGAWVPGFARQVQKAGFLGAEHICGIPGSIGGLICMNGGSQRKSIGTSVVEVSSVNEKGEEVLRCNEQCHFSYRNSIYQKNSEIITFAKFGFNKAIDSKVVRREMLVILSQRRKKFPQKSPNCGSIFKSDPSLYTQLGAPGSVIEKLGFKGKRLGDAIVSPQHANFIINTGAARSRDIAELIYQIQVAVFDKTGFMLESEVQFVSPMGDIQAPEHSRA